MILVRACCSAGLLMSGGASALALLVICNQELRDLERIVEISIKQMKSKQSGSKVNLPLPLATPRVPSKVCTTPTTHTTSTSSSPASMVAGASPPRAGSPGAPWGAVPPTWFQGDLWDEARWAPPAGPPDPQDLPLPSGGAGLWGRLEAPHLPCEGRPTESSTACAPRGASPS